jgi:hypothetical protein
MFSTYVIKQNLKAGGYVHDIEMLGAEFTSFYSNESYR